MRTFYDRGGVRVTEQWFTVGDAKYPVIELQRLFVARGPRHPGDVSGGRRSGLAYFEDTARPAPQEPDPDDGHHGHLTGRHDQRPPRSAVPAAGVVRAVTAGRGA